MVASGNLVEEPLRAVLQDQIYGSGWACLRPEDVTGARDPSGQLAGDLVRCALVELHLDLLVLGPLSDLLVLVLRLVRARLGHAAAHSLQDEEEEQPQAAAQGQTYLVSIAGSDSWSAFASMIKPADADVQGKWITAIPRRGRTLNERVGK